MSKDAEAETVTARRARMALAARQSSPYPARADAAGPLGLSENTLGRYERGERDIPMEVIETMERLYRLPAGYLAYPNGVPRETSPGFPAHGDAAAGVLWAAEQMSETVTRLIREARRSGVRATESAGGPGLASTDAFGEAPPGLPDQAKRQG